MGCRFLAVVIFCLTFWPSIGRGAGTYLVADGDSLTAGYGGGGVSGAWPKHLGDLLPSLAHTNRGINGYKIASNTGASNSLPYLTNASSSGYTRLVVVLWEFINDIVTPDSVATITNNYRSWITAVEGSFPNAKLIAITQYQIYGISETQSNRVEQVNAWIRTNGLFDAVVDVAADARFQNYSNTTYFYTDAVHLNSTGYQVVAQLMYDTMQTAGLLSHYIRAGASGAGTGDDWTDAWANFTGVTWKRNELFYLAGGFYSDWGTMSASASGTKWIVLRKANAAENAGVTGWNASYASSEAVIDAEAIINSDYIEIDGITGSGMTGHGIKFWRTNDTADDTVLLVGNGNGPVRLYHTELMGPGYASSTYATHGFYANGAVKGLTITNCYIHEVSGNGVLAQPLSGTSWVDYGLLFQGNVVSETGGCLDADKHGQGVQMQSGDYAYLTFRNNRFRNITGTGIIMFLGGTTAAREVRIYNNIFEMTNGTVYGGGSSYSPVGSLEAATASTNILFANNTIYGITNGNNASLMLIAAASTNGNSVVNNLYEGCSFWQAQVGAATNSANGFYGNAYKNAGGQTCTNGQVLGKSSALSNPASRDFTLNPASYAIGVGIDLSAYFTTDFTGATRTAWDIGAYAYGAAGPTYLRAVTARAGTVRVR